MKSSSSPLAEVSDSFPVRVFFTRLPNSPAREMDQKQGASFPAPPPHRTPFVPSPPGN